MPFRRDNRVTLRFIHRMLPRHRWAIAVCVVLVAVLILRSRWQPTHQVRVHTEALLAAVAGKDWRGLEGLLADDYSDTWGHSKAMVVDQVSEVFRQFFTIELTAPEMSVEKAEGGEGIARARLTLRGRGGPFAEIAVQRVAELHEPFTFTWRKRSWKPWDWALVRVEQPELRVE